MTRAAAFPARATTRRWGLTGSEWSTSGVAAVVSSAAYLAAGFDYLARGVVGDLLGLALLAAVGTAVGARVRHEAAVCLALIGVVVLASPAWPLRLREAVWWGLFVLGLSAYLVLRRRVTD